MAFPRASDDDIFGQVALGLLALVLVIAVVVSLV